MKTIWASRRIPLALTVLVAFFSALGALAISNGHDAHAHGSGSHEATAADRKIVTHTELAFRNGMRQLWEDHIVWTRLAIISLTTDAPDTEATVGRLLQNQTDIGNAVEPFYGEAAGDKLTAELRRHILIAADLIAAARAGDEAKLAEEQARWEANADDIAAVLNSVNPRHFNLTALKTEMRTHLRLTTDEAVARLQGNWAADVAAYDEIHGHILHLADYLSDGIVKQFPRRFR
ncbi:MAG TPA: hypothetical protein VFZ12_05325 [Dehalococcoidia bacterium]|nr:hypothetical protein [Dehalococcoidia bacterium]